MFGKNRSPKKAELLKKYKSAYEIAGAILPPTIYTKRTNRYRHLYIHLLIAL